MIVKDRTISNPATLMPLASRRRRISSFSFMIARYPRASFGAQNRANSGATKRVRPSSFRLCFWPSFDSDLGAILKWFMVSSCWSCFRSFFSSRLSFVSSSSRASLRLVFSSSRLVLRLALLEFSFFLTHRPFHAATGFAPEKKRFPKATIVNPNVSDSLFFSRVWGVPDRV